MSLIQPPSESMANYESKSSCLSTLSGWVFKIFMVLSGWVFKILMVFLIESSSFSIANLEKKSSVCKSVYGVFLLFIFAGSMHQPLESKLHEDITCKLYSLLEIIES